MARLRQHPCLLYRSSQAVVKRTVSQGKAVATSADQQIAGNDARERGFFVLAARLVCLARANQLHGTRLSSGVWLIFAILERRGMLDTRGFGRDSYRTRRKDVAA